MPRLYANWGSFMNLWAYACVNNEWNIMIVSSKSHTNTLSTSFSGGEFVDNEVGDDESWASTFNWCCCDCWFKDNDAADDDGLFVWFELAVTFILFDFLAFLPFSKMVF